MASMSALTAAIALLLLGSGAAQSKMAGSTQQARYVDSRGAVWGAVPNEHGAVLKNASIRIYLGRSCEAVSPGLGRGHWGSANGGVVVTFSRRSFAFPRQDSPVPAARCTLPPR